MSFCDLPSPLSLCRKYKKGQEDEIINREAALHSLEVSRKEMADLQSFKDKQKKQR